MKLSKKLWLILGGSGLLLLCMFFGAFVAGPLSAFAQNASAPAAAKATSSPYCTLYNQSLAKSLNVSTDTLNQDRLSARTSVLNQMVKDGKLTQAQANTIEQKRAKQQVCKSFNAHTYELAAVRQYLMAHRSDLLTQVAKGLNMQVSDLTAQLKSGKSLDSIATAHNISASALQNLVSTAVNNQVNSGASNGDLTKDQLSAYQQYTKNHPNLFIRLDGKHGHVKKAK